MRAKIKRTGEIIDVYPVNEELGGGFIATGRGIPRIFESQELILMDDDENVGIYWKLCRYLNIRKWYKILKQKLAKLFLRWSLKLDPRYDIHWPIGWFPEITGYKRPLHLKRMVRMSMYEAMRYKTSSKVSEAIKEDLMRHAIDDLIKHMVDNKFITIHFEKDDDLQTFDAIVEVEVLEPYNNNH